jgi:hypothetical protein
MCAAGVKDAFDHARGTFARQERHQPARGGRVYVLDCLWAPLGAYGAVY